MYDINIGDMYLVFKEELHQHFGHWIMGCVFYVFYATWLEKIDDSLCMNNKW